ncbi:SEC-C metal-binding domain-containing protein [Marinobacter denitrificans]|nr:SEC-C domain-containing protein [Marinobacter sp. JB05H06]
MPVIFTVTSPSRNNLCNCGSGIKFNKCCGRRQPWHRRKWL